MSNWDLQVERGRQTWHYKEDSKNQPSDAVVHLLQLQEPGTTCPKGCNMTKAATPFEAVQKGIQYLSAIQTSDGHWAGDYGGPLFLLPGMLITCYVCEVSLKEEQKKEMIRYLLSRQRSDGGWGLHIEAKSDMFGSALQYVSLRILGLPSDHPSIIRARTFIKDHGGAVGIPSWGKLWLAVMGVYDYSGLNPIPIELWLSPYWLPFAPGRMWCHCRMVYLPMAYIYAQRIQSKVTPLVSSLRDELYIDPYNKIDWPNQRNNISPLDMYHKHSPILDVINTVLYYYEKIHSTWLRQKAVELTFDHVRYEDEQTKYIDIGPVNKVMNMLCVFSHEGKSEAFWKHFDRLSDYLWLAEDGMKMQGYNGSQLWDTTFAVQAILESSSIARQFPDTLQLAHDYIDISQVRDNTPDYQKYFRHISKGAWPFSTVDHGWPISDCTAEGVKASLLLRDMPFISAPISNDRLADAINVILSLQNSDGGWASYENKRAGNWMELINPSEVFHNIMIDYSYVECSSACVQAMIKFKHMMEETARITKKMPPRARLGEINKSINRGIQFIKNIQRPDGGWIGSWGICFTYGTWFGMEALIASGESKNSDSVLRACAFLVSKQRDDGGWGESFMSNVSKEYVQHPTESHAVNTAWALLSLMSACYEDRSVIDRGVQFLMSKQLPNGDYPQQAIIGVFNFNCMISYSNYKNIFPTWALARYYNIYHTSRL
eukprot:TRINITY_DN3011_c0_g1_i1.p1 TRINITY_DN3011_c0_g1~~TRINITY_DN3011_c0_g1_i1.p1  ORF type:complete len:715 (+),score=199.90 TRINITY_DN3011_c0_g1_i1:34-2178(+)